MVLKLLLLVCFACSAFGAQILIVTYEASGGYDQMQTHLEDAGHTVTQVSGVTDGSLSTALSGGGFDQVFLFDLTSGAFLDGSDLAALVDFWDAHRGLVVDTRSYGYHFQGDNASEVALLQNVAANFVLTGGGVWVGTDHDPDWTNNGNAFLNAIGVNPVTGLFSDPVNYADPASVLLAGVTPTELWGGGQSVGAAPIGIQPNGIEMFIHFGHTRTDGSVLPYISASFPLQGPPPSDVPEPSTMLLSGAALAALGLRARRQRR